MIQEELIKEALTKYCHWLNLWQRDEAHTGGGTVHLYDPRQFMTHEPSVRLYGSSTIHAIIPVGNSAAFERILVPMTVTDGDDGGPTELYCTFEQDGDSWKLIHMVQGFDTYLQEVYNTTISKDSPFLHTP